jgi:hypothetical protein
MEAMHRFFEDRVLQTICPGLSSNGDPPDLCLLSCWDHRREPLASSLNDFEVLNKQKVSRTLVDLLKIRAGNYGSFSK